MFCLNISPMTELKKGHELEEPPYDYFEINQFEQVSFTKFTHIDKIRYDDSEDEIVLLASIEVTPDRERIISDHLQNISEELGRPLTVVGVTEEEVRVQMPTSFRLE